MDRKSLDQFDWLVNVENKDSLLRITDLDQDDDLERRPNHSYASLIRNAILSSPGQRCTLANIYEWIEDKYPFFRRAGKGWKNSIRHNLSLNKSFRKLFRSPTDPGKGCYWTWTEDCSQVNRVCESKRNGNKMRIKSNSNNCLTQPQMPSVSSSMSFPEPFLNFPPNSMPNPDPWFDSRPLSPSWWTTGPSADQLSAAMRMSGLYEENTDALLANMAFGINESNEDELMRMAFNANNNFMQQAADVLNHVSKKDLLLDLSTLPACPSLGPESLAGSRRRSSSHSLRGLMNDVDKHAFVAYSENNGAHALIDEFNWDALL